MPRAASAPPRKRDRPVRVGAPLLVLLTVLVPSAGAQPRGDTNEAPLVRPNPILFVTQPPIPDDVATATSSFANHLADPGHAGRGGDLWILYPDGTLRNLTQEAGYGLPDTSVPGAPPGFQGATSIAVRDPCVHWSGTRALFAMVVGAPRWNEQHLQQTWNWQLYEVIGLGQGQTAAISRVPLQPATYNNLSPCYGSDGRILFTSDRPRDGKAHLYPQFDEYRGEQTVTGLWSLDPQSGDLRLLDHSPSGDFGPKVDSFGRVVFVRWDHLQRDGLANDDDQGGAYGTFDWTDESPGATAVARAPEIFPEPFPNRTDLLRPWEVGFEFNHFFPWTINQDGTAMETLNHIGRHELAFAVNRARNDDPRIVPFQSTSMPRTNPNWIANFFQVRERPDLAGSYLGVDAQESQTHAAGQVIEIALAPNVPADAASVVYRTHRLTAFPSSSPPACHSGLYRDPLPLSDGSLVAAHAGYRADTSGPETRIDVNGGTAQNPLSRYQFRLRNLVADSTPGCTTSLRAGATLTNGIAKAVSWWDPDQLVSYSASVPMWELEPVEVRSRPVPPQPGSPLPSPEAQVFAEEHVDEQAFRQSLADLGLGLIVSRNVTTRDRADRQQPFNLHVAGGSATTLADDYLVGDTIYDIAQLQIFQADLVRGRGGVATPVPGRRVLPRPLHDPAATNPPAPGLLPGAVALGADGSLAALVPAHRAITYQLNDAAGLPVIHERFWITLQPGEVRVCASCHGVNSHDQAGASGAPQNPPEALRHLLQVFRPLHLFDDSFENGLARWTHP